MIYLNTAQAAAIFKRARLTITGYCTRGLIPGAVKIRGRWRIPADVDEIRVGQYEVVQAAGLTVEGVRVSAPK